MSATKNSMEIVDFFSSKKYSDNYSSLSEVKFITSINLLQLYSKLIWTLIYFFQGLNVSVFGIFHGWGSWRTQRTPKILVTTTLSHVNTRNQTQYAVVTSQGHTPALSWTLLYNEYCASANNMGSAAAHLNIWTEEESLGPDLLWQMVLWWWWSGTCHPV